MEITKVVKPFIRKGWSNTFGNIVYLYIRMHSLSSSIAHDIFSNIIFAMTNAVPFINSSNCTQLSSIISILILYLKIKNELLNFKIWGQKHSCMSSCFYLPFRHNIVNFSLFCHWVCIYVQVPYVTLDHKTSLTSLGYICSNSQKYTVCVNIIDFSFMAKIIKTLSKDHVPWRYFVHFLLWIYQNLISD